MRALRIIAGIIAGLAVSLGTSILFFQLTHHLPTAPASRGYLIAAGFSGVFFSLLTGYLTTFIAASRLSAWITAALIALLDLMAVFEAHSATHDPTKSLALTWLSLCLLVPAIILGGYIRRP